VHQVIKSSSDPTVQKALYNQIFDKPYSPALNVLELENQAVNVVYWDTFCQIHRQSKLFPNLHKPGTRHNPYKAYLFMMTSNIVDVTPQARNRGAQAGNSVTPSAGLEWQSMHTAEQMPFDTPMAQQTITPSPALNAPAPALTPLQQVETTTLSPDPALQAFCSITNAQYQTLQQEIAGFCELLTPARPPTPAIYDLDDNVSFIRQDLATPMPPPIDQHPNVHFDEHIHDCPVCPPATVKSSAKIVKEINKCIHKQSIKQLEFTTQIDRRQHSFQHWIRQS
jgi:hypothetical protein